MTHTLLPPPPLLSASPALCSLILPPPSQPGSLSLLGWWLTNTSTAWIPIWTAAGMSGQWGHHTYWIRSEFIFPACSWWFIVDLWNFVSGKKWQIKITEWEWEEWLSKNITFLPVRMKAAKDQSAVSLRQTEDLDLMHHETLVIVGL